MGWELRIRKSTWALSIAASTQKYFEDQIKQYIDFHIKDNNIADIVLAGGAFANVKLNQAVYQLESVRNIHIHPAMSDAGLGAGAALNIAHKQKEYQISPLSNVFLGPSYSNSQIEQDLKNYGVVYYKPDDSNLEVASILANGNTLARFDGRLEYGPRALGNRSILYQTTDKTVNKWLNKKLKRTEFMPFAPITLAEFFTQCYKTEDKDLNIYDFMTITVDCTQRMKEESPAVVHIDGTARPQLVSETNNPGLHSILYSYYKLTGIPSLINTSFNPHEEPIVCNPNEAIKAFLDCELDFLQIGIFIVEGNQKGTPDS